MPIELYPSIAKIKRNGVYENLPGFVPGTGSVATQHMIATSESSNVAQYVHNKGEYFILNDTLYQAIVKINAGDSIVVGTNCEVAVLGNDVTHIANSIAEYELGIATNAHNKGEYFMVGETMYIATADIQVGDTISTSTNCRKAVVGDELSGLNTTFNGKIESLSKGLTPKSYVPTMYITSGNYYYFSESSKKFLKASSKTLLSTRYVNNVYETTCGFECRLAGIQMRLVYFNENGTASTSGSTGYLGHTANGTGIIFFPPEAKKFLLTFSKIDGSAITSAEASAIPNNIYRYYFIDSSLTMDGKPADAKVVGNKLAKIENNTTLASSPLFGDVVSTIFTNNDSNAIAGVDDGMLNNVSVVKISDEMYYMYYGAYAIGESGYANESTCFAYSTDGVNFTKGFPNGITPPFSGSTRVLAKGAAHGASVVKVPDNDYPFRLVGIDGTDADRVAKLWKSTDGINWVYLKQITQGYNDSFPSCIVRGNTLKFYLRSRDSNHNRIIVTLITDLDGNHISLGWNQIITLNDATKQLYCASASRLDDQRDLLIPTVYNPTDSSETVCFIITDGGHMEVIEPSTTNVITNDVKSIYFSPNIVGISYFNHVFYTTRNTDHESTSSSTVSSIKRVRIYDNTITNIVRP